MSDKEIRRRRVASLILIRAWRLKRRSNTTMSCVLLVSWRSYKGSVRVRYSKVVGVTFENRQAVLQKLYKLRDNQVALSIHREPDNTYDTNAIKVMATVQGITSHIGYIPKYAAGVLAPMIDAGHQMIVFYDGIYKNSRQNTIYGLSIRYALLDSDLI